MAGCNEYTQKYKLQKASLKRNLCLCDVQYVRSSLFLLYFVEFLFLIHESYNLAMLAWAHPNIDDGNQLFLVNVTWIHQSRDLSSYLIIDVCHLKTGFTLELDESS